MKLPAILAIITSLSIFAYAQNEAQYPITEPYAFPLRPGTEEWKSIDGIGEMYNVCDLPAETAKQMTTEALIKTIMDYPLKFLIYSSNQSLAAGLTNVANHFAAIPELYTRQDAPALLINEYKSHSANYNRDFNRSKSIEQTFLTYILCEDRFLDRLSKDQSKDLASTAVANIRATRQRFGFTADEGGPGRLVVKLLNKKELQIDRGDQRLTKDSLPVHESEVLAKGALGFVPEKEFFDKMIAVAPQN